MLSVWNLRICLNCRDLSKQPSNIPFTTVNIVQTLTFTLYPPWMLNPPYPKIWWLFKALWKSTCRECAVIRRGGKQCIYKSITQQSTWFQGCRCDVKWDPGKTKWYQKPDSDKRPCSRPTQRRTRTRGLSVYVTDAWGLTSGWRCEDADHIMHNSMYIYI